MKAQAPNARSLLRFSPDAKLRDADAARQPLSDAAGSNAKQDIKEATARLLGRLADLQPMLQAQGKHKVLLVLQGMDTSGKDGAVRSLFSTINPVGLRAVSFKAPSEIELGHDFLWRVHRETPAKGELVVFNRSHYEDVLITRVLGMIDAKECRRRYAHIRDFERMLAETGTTLLKVFLHISKDEQRERLQARLDDPAKRWKLDPADFEQRKKWSVFQRAYQDAMQATDADHAPWYVVPADSKPHRNLAIASLLLETLERLKLDWPKPDPALLDMKFK
ncbi:polyphosphate kinase [Massilia sp. Root418]|uniref:PPK2 family polyphosphate kinase n=1 Tax=Massilia sp. Root418 TaxID=1736532 RepID=UPI0006F6965B|nr:PPK2 family polyphosphate kinase [Massilia sp. Root418]KQW90044.1 polyphosphate kinase [Massilia sp. Root418]